MSGRTSELLEASAANGCVFCGYNGENFYQAGTHHVSCPWFPIGGRRERDVAFVSMIRATWDRMVQAEADRWPCPHCDATCPHGTGEQAELAPGEGGRPHFVTGMTVIGMPEPPEPIGWQNAPDLADILDGTENRDRLDPFTRLAPPDAALPPAEAWKPAPVIGRTLDEVVAGFDDPLAELRAMPAPVVYLSEHPLVQRTYDLVRAIDSLPASLVATALVIEAGALFDLIKRYVASIRSVMVPCCNNPECEWCAGTGEALSTPPTEAQETAAQQWLR